MRMSKKEIDKILKEDTAPLWKRGIAFIIDMIILNVIILVPLQELIVPGIDIEGISSLKEAFTAAQTIEPNTATIIVVSVIIAILTLTYFVILEKTLKQTIGKMIMRIKVESLKKELSWGQTIIRNITKAIVFNLSIILLLDIIYLIFNKKQKYTDVLSKTEVKNV